MKKRGIELYFETSAKEDTNVNEAFQTVIEAILEKIKIDADLIDDATRVEMNRSRSKPINKKSCC